MSVESRASLPGKQAGGGEQGVAQAQVVLAVEANGDRGEGDVHLPAGAQVDTQVAVVCQRLRLTARGRAHRGYLNMRMPSVRGQKMKPPPRRSSSGKVPCSASWMW